MQLVVPQKLAARLAYKTSSECCRVCRKSLLCTIWWWFNSEVLVWHRVRWVNHATCGTSETCGLLSIQIYLRGL